MPTAAHAALRSAPAYAEMVEDILAGVANGSLQAGQRLASEVMLKEQYGISITSIKRGLNLLVERNVLRRQRGSGTFVADTAPATAQPLVRRDTIAIVRGWLYWRYHPYFSEQHNGLLAGLARHGWKPLEIQDGPQDRLPADREVSFRQVSPELVRLDLKQHPEVAGIVCAQGAEPVGVALAEDGQIVVHAGTVDISPFVAYDWQAEIERLFRVAIAKGARCLSCVSSLSNEELNEMCGRSARAAGLATGDVSLRCFQCEPSHAGSPLITRAYQAALEAFQARPCFDGLIITSDFEAIGVTDALATLPRSTWDDVTVVALLNKESRLHARIPMTALVADGYACGLALSDMVHEQITTGGNCCRNILMSCYQMEWR